MKVKLKPIKYNGKRGWVLPIDIIPPKGTKYVEFKIIENDKNTK